MKSLLTKSRWIWLSETSELNQYVDFRRSFSLPFKHGRVLLYISADSRYSAFINGQYIPASQYADYTNYKVYDTLDITEQVHEGQNVLAIVGYFQGEDSSIYRLGQAGLWFTVVAECGHSIYSDAQTYCRLSREYVSGEIERFTPQLSFSFAYRAMGYDGWHEESYVLNAEWTAACETGYTPALYPRPIKLLSWNDRHTAHILSQGVFRDENFAAPCGDRIQYAAMSYRLPSTLGLLSCPAKLPSTTGYHMSSSEGDGIFVLVDLGEEESGVLELDIEFSQTTQVLIGFGEHLDDLRVRSAVGNRQFAVLYEGKPGRQSFIHYFKRIGCRYIQLHVYAHDFVLYYAGVRPTTYPVTPRPCFQCADALHNRIFEISCRTLLLCMHEHYEDCPWREQALYAMDSRSQMLYGYYAFGEVEFAQASLRLLALGQRSDGLLELCAPAKVDVTIPIFSLNFIQAVCENVTFSGDVAFGREMLAVMERILITFFNRMDSCGLVPAFSEIPYWNFYDWAEGLDGGTIFKTEESPHSYDSPLNALLSIILAQMAELYTCLGDTEKSSACIKAHESLNSALEAFWDEQRGVYATYLTDNGLEHYCELSQALIICAGAVPIQRKERILTMLTGSHGILIPTTPGMKIFKYDALMQCPEKYAEWVKEDIGVTWGNMLFSGATSFWETAKGAWDFESAGSLCHGWSSVPIYFYCRYVLGEQLNGQREKPIFCGLYDCKRVIKY